MNTIINTFLKVSTAAYIPIPFYIGYMAYNLRLLCFGNNIKELDAPKEKFKTRLYVGGSIVCGSFMSYLMINQTLKSKLHYPDFSRDKIIRNQKRTIFSCICGCIAININIKMTNLIYNIYQFNQSSRLLTEYARSVKKQK